MKILTKPISQKYQSPTKLLIKLISLKISLIHTLPLLHEVKKFRMGMTQSTVDFIYFEVFNLLKYML